ncbi:MAG TPA: prephenate dehydrogenase [Methanosarcinales archaeon]|nr:prephenate dehydrogenase [Methanosarcinales archaeon]
MKILIIGGTGELGQWFARFFLNQGYEVTVSGKSGRVEIAKKLGVEFADDVKQSAKNSDIVMISVPINVTEKVIKDVAPNMQSGSLLMDVTSVKVGPMNAMKQFAPEGVEILGTHPMFGPSIPNLKGQTIILCPDKDYKDGYWFPIIKNIFKSNGAHVEILDAEKHDKMMAVIQGLTHFAYITIGSTFTELNFDVAESRKFMSPIYEIMVDIVGRILAQNPYLYAMIQMNPYITPVHESFINQCKKISDIVREQDIESFVKEMKKAAIHFRDTESALRRSDKLINLKISEYEYLLHSLEKNKEVALKHIYSGVVHTGVLKNVSPISVRLKRNKKSIELKLENIQLLKDSELQRWKIENLQHTNRDISVIIPKNANPEVIKDIISKTSGVISVEIIDIYDKLPNTDRNSVTYRITIIGDRNPYEILSKVEDLLIGIGCIRR